MKDLTVQKSTYCSQMCAIYFKEQFANTKLFTIIQLKQKKYFIFRLLDKSEKTFETVELYEEFKPDNSGFQFNKNIRHFASISSTLNAPVFRTNDFFLVTFWL